MKQGVLVTNGVILERHEMMTVNFLLRLGFNIELIPKSNRAGVRTPDLRMLNLEWEMKSPKGQGKYLLQNVVHRAARQSENIIVDLRRVKIHPMKCLNELDKQFNYSKRCRRMKVITKTGEVVDLCKKS